MVSISLCMIVRNEEKVLGRCLACVQGFADEIFRVFQNAHPDIVLRPINANEAVLGMIQHVIRA